MKKKSEANFVKIGNSPQKSILINSGLPFLHIAHTNIWHSPYHSILYWETGERLEGRIFLDTEQVSLYFGM